MRWRFQHDFLVLWLAGLIAKQRRVSKKKAADQIEAACERAMSLRGIKYPFKETDR